MPRPRRNACLALGLLLATAVAAVGAQAPALASMVSSLSRLESQVGSTNTDLALLRRDLDRVLTHLGMRGGDSDDASSSAAHKADATSRTDDAMFPAHRQDHRGLSGDDAATSMENVTRIDKLSVATSTARVAKNLHVSGNVYVHGSIVYQEMILPVPTTPRPTPSPTLQPTPSPSPGPTETPCSPTGVYAPFETGTKCPLVHFDMETLDGAQVKDLIGGHNLNVVGSPEAGVSGAVGLTYQIKSAGDYFLSAAGDFPTTLEFANPKSLAAWVYITSAGGDGDGAMPFASFGRDSSDCLNSAVGMDCNVNTGNFQLITCGNDMTVSASTVSGMCGVGAWHHYAIAFGEESGGCNGAYMFFDGQLVKSGSLCGVDTERNMGIGVGVDTWHSATHHHLSNGRVDEVRMYDYALTTAEAAELFGLKD